MLRAVVARLTGLEPATPGVTGRYSNQLSYNRSLPPASGRDAGSMVSALPRQALSRAFLMQKVDPLKAATDRLIELVSQTFEPIPLLLKQEP